MEQLIHCIQSRDLLKLRKIISENNNVVNWKLPKGTPLHYSAAFGHLAIVNELLENGALQTVASTGLTPLMEASLEGHATIVLTLFRKDNSGMGADNRNLIC